MASLAMEPDITVDPLDVSRAELWRDYQWREPFAELRAKSPISPPLYCLRTAPLQALFIIIIFSRFYRAFIVVVMSIIINIFVVVVHRGTNPTTV